jgi:hypothetical protein
VAGTSGSSAPSWAAPAWTNYNGSTTTDGTVTWEYFGDPCPTNDKFTWVMEASEPDLIGANGIPALWVGAGATNGSNTATPVFYNWSAGTATANTACAMDANLCTALEQPHPWMPMARLRWREGFR